MTGNGQCALSDERCYIKGLERRIDGEVRVLHIAANSTLCICFNGEAAGRAIALDGEVYSVVSLHEAGHKPGSQVGMTQNERFHDSKTMIRPHLVDHPRPVKKPATVVVVVEQKDVHPVFGDRA